MIINVVFSISPFIYYIYTVYS